MKLAQKKKLSNKIIIVDGFTASGKGIFCKYLQTFNKVSKMNVDHIFAEIGFLVKRNKIDKNYAISLFNNRLDMYYENDFLSRDLNFRPYDDSSIFQSNQVMYYLKNLFSKDGDSQLKRISENHKYFLIMSHFSSPHKNFFFECLGKDLIFISMVRHPVYIFDFWLDHFKSINSDSPRMYKFLYKKKNQKLFWYEGGGPKNTENLYDRVIKSMLYLKRIDDSINPYYSENFIQIPFESFIYNTEDVEKLITKKINIKKTTNTKKFKFKNNLPEDPYIYRSMNRKRFGWKLNRSKETKLIFDKRILNIKKNASNFYFKEFQKIYKEYELLHDLPFYQ